MVKFRRQQGTRKFPALKWILKGFFHTKGYVLRWSYSNNKTLMKGEHKVSCLLDRRYYFTLERKLAKLCKEKTIKVLRRC